MLRVSSEFLFSFSSHFPLFSPPLLRHCYSLFPPYFPPDTDEKGFTGTGSSSKPKVQASFAESSRSFFPQGAKYRGYPRTDEKFELFRPFFTTSANLWQSRGCLAVFLRRRSLKKLAISRVAKRRLNVFRVAVFLLRISVS